MAQRILKCYRVHFTEAPLKDDARTDFFFTSLSAIYEIFSREQIGCGFNRLYNLRVPDGVPYQGRKCQITQETLHSKAQRRRMWASNGSDEQQHDEKE